MNQHVVFAGGWNNVGSTAAKKADLDPTDTFSLEVRLFRQTATTTVSNGATLNFKLPDNLRTIRHVGHRDRIHTAGRGLRLLTDDTTV